MIPFDQGTKPLKGIAEMGRDHSVADISGMKTTKKGIRIEACFSSFPNQLSVSYYVEQPTVLHNTIFHPSKNLQEIILYC